MPASIFSGAELARLAGFPEEIPRSELIRSFTLTGPDRDLAEIRRRPANRLGVALQLCVLRYLGFVPRPIESAPSSAIRFVAAQLQVDPGEIRSYAERPQTRREHLAEIKEHLRFASPVPRDLVDLESWLTERALEHDAPRFLFRLARERLRTQRIVSPAPDRIVRLISSARARAQERTFSVVEPLLTAERRHQLDELIETKDSSGRSIVKWLGQGSPGESPQSINGEVEKLVYLRELGAHEWDLSRLNPNRRKFLAQVGRRSTSQTLRRMPDLRRYPILIALLHETTIDLVDEIVDLFDRALRKADSRSRRELDEWKVTTARATNAKVRLFSRLGHLILDPTVPDDQLRLRIFKAFTSRDRFAEAVVESDQLLRPRDDSHLDFVENRYGHLRKFAPTVLQELQFRALTTDDPLIGAVEVLKELNRTGRRRVPDVGQLDFAPRKWKEQLVDGEGQVKRRSFELCVLYQLRDGLRSGDVWIPGSRRYANPSTYLMPPEKWASERTETLRLLDLEEDAGRHLEPLVASTAAAIQRLDESGLAESESLRIDHGRIVLSPSSPQKLPDEVLRLNTLVAERLPRVELAEVLIEVDAWTGFSESFSHAGGARSRNPDLVSHVYAAIVAQACNFGLTTMADIGDLTYRQLAWTNDWYLREETLKEAFSQIVDYQHRLPLSKAWGGGTLSSSDGQRFPVRGSADNATALPKYFGLGKGLTFYTWTSDQYSQFGSKVIPSTVRDATYVLDEILDNQTDLPILEHTTDTAGYTEIVFALFHLLGLQFAPRIRDLGAQRLYRLDSPPRKTGLGSLLKGLVRSRSIVDNWDDLLRIAGSLKLGWVTASLLLSKLQAGSRANTLARALRDLGRLAKTRFILHWIEDEDYRRRIHRQLNKGEALHALRRFLFFAHEGKVWRRQAEQQTDQVLCLNLVTNAIVTWNTVYMTAAVDQLKAEGKISADIELGHLSPALYGHVNPYGKYRFRIESRAELRPLRRPRDDP